MVPAKGLEPPLDDDFLIQLSALISALEILAKITEVTEICGRGRQMVMDFDR